MATIPSRTEMTMEMTPLYLGLEFAKNEARNKYKKMIISRTIKRQEVSRLTRDFIYNKNNFLKKNKKKFSKSVDTILKIR